VNAESRGAGLRREARLQRIHALQGIRAGFVSRILAYAIDIALLLFFGVLAACFIGLMRWIFTSAGFSLDRPHGWAWLIGSFLFATLYFDYLWSTTGRSLGEQFFGLRTVRADGSHVRGWRAFLRGVLYVVFAVGLLWIVVSKRNSAVQDLVCGTAVVYDWSYHPPGD
jgi:uncharacterized RDD family membrane protein YckC